MAALPIQQQEKRRGGEPLEGADGTIDDLKLALVENLEYRGVLGKLKAKVRAEIFHTLEGPQEGVVPPPLSNDNLLINELVRDYLSYNGYVNALGVFMAESGQPNDGALDRGFIRDELGLTESRDPGEGGRLPLLYGITHALKRWKKGCSMEEGEGRGKGEEFHGGGRRVGIGPPRVPVRAEDGLLTNQDTQATHQLYQSNGIGADGSGIGKSDPAPWMFTKRGGDGR